MPPMPAVVVLFLCKVAIAGPPDQNAGWTGSQNLEWATEHSMMVCRRQEVQMYDPAEAQGADARPFTQMDCWRSGLMLGAGWDAAHRGSRYRFWKVACPVPIRSGPKETDPVIGWKLPDCGNRQTVICEQDTAI